MEDPAEIRPDQPGQPAADAGPQEEGIFRDGEHLHREPFAVAGCAGKEDLQIDQRRRAAYPPREQPLPQRTHPKDHEKVLPIASRLLYVWHMRHPASGYVQGINDVATPFIVVFLSEYVQLNFDSLDAPA